MKQFILPELPYSLDGLEPVLSKETLEYHYGKHHAAYINNLNGLIAGTDFENMPIEDIVARSDAGPMFNNSAQAYNHTFYWYGMKPPMPGDEANLPSDQIGQAINEAFGGFDEFKTQFSEIAAKHFGSGWAWLLKDSDGKLAMKGMHDADTPIKNGGTPLLALDVWEHAYYVDYRNKRPDYITAFWQLVDWKFVEGQLLAPSREPLMLTVDQA
jgi:superoxide dismutase, Fe-Mn family